MCNQTSQILPSWSRKRYFKLASAALRTDNGVEGNFICMKLQFRPQKNAFQSMPARLFDHPFANLGESRALTQVDTPNNLPSNIWTCPGYSIPTNPWQSKTTRSFPRKWFSGPQANGGNNQEHVASVPHVSRRSGHCWHATSPPVGLSKIKNCCIES